jgi:hypothetical protein
VLVAVRRLRLAQRKTHCAAPLVTGYPQNSAVGKRLTTGEKAPDNDGSVDSALATAQSCELQSRQHDYGARKQLQLRKNAC